MPSRGKKMISVIVPVYKVEQYLDKCVQSILAQTYKQFEVILVDDGSPDSCPQICDRYAKKDKRVRVLHKDNGGLSDARNEGTKIAEGDYVTYVDSDDYISKDYLATLSELLKKYKADIAVTGIEVFDENDYPKCKKKGIEYVYSGKSALEKMLYQNTLDTSACAMLLPIKIALDNPFPVGMYHEDEFTTYKYYSAVNRVVVTTRQQYYYLQRKGSIMHVFGKASIDELDAADNLVNFCRENYPDLIKAAESKKFSDYCQVLLAGFNLKKDFRDVYNRIFSYLKDKRIQIFLDGNCRKKNRIAAMLLLFGEKPLYWGNKFKR